MREIAALDAEVDELAALLDTLAPGDWQLPTLFKGWTINDVVLHLYASDLLGLTTLLSAEAYATLRGEMLSTRAQWKLSMIEESRLRFPRLHGRELLALWRGQAAEVSRRLADRDPQDKLAWAGPPMSASTFATARQMENWAHGQAVYDVLGRQRQPHDRLVHIALLGVKTFKWSYVNRQLTPPAQPPRVCLQAPSGAEWVWNEASTAGAVQGSALDFCQVVTQVRSVHDTGLRLEGPVAHEWMSIAQCFAGPPVDPPQQGYRRARHGATGLA